jgi:hypothetical protein
MNFDTTRVQHPNEQESVIVVSGLPRSGTSMMMRMLDAGGVPILTDHERRADDDNPTGYYEFERVKKLRQGDYEWLSDARGKAVKIISSLLPHLAPGLQYKILFLRRALPEILASQRQMLLRRGEPADPAEDAPMAAVYEKHLAYINRWLSEQPNLEVLYVDHQQAIAEPTVIAGRVNFFLGGHLDETAMAAAVEPRLYRQRG